MSQALAVLMRFLLAASAAAAQEGKTGPAPAAPQASTANIAALAKKAEAARQADQTDEAIRLYKQILQVKPDSAENWWYLGTLYYESDQYLDGQTAFRHVTGLKPQMALGWAMLGLCEFETKQYERALAHLQRADQLKIPKDQDFYQVSRYHLALLLTRSGQFEAAVRILVDFAREGPTGPQTMEAMGLAGLRKALLPEELPPQEREIVLDVGHAMCDAAARRASELDQDIAELARKYPKTPNVHYLAGSILLASDPDRALDEFKEELTVSPAHALAMVAVAEEYLKRGDYEAALPYAEKAVTADPRSFTPHAILGQILTKGSLDMPRGIHELEAAVRLAPGQAQVHYALATAYAKGGRKQDADKEWAEFLRLRGNN